MNSSIPVSASVATLQSEWDRLLEDAAREVCLVMMGTDICRLQAEAEPDVPEHTAMVGLAGTLCGVVSVRCSPATAAVIASKMLGTPVDAGDEQTRDALAEVCNMIAGAFKNQSPRLQRDCMLSVPTVVTGADYRLQTMAKGHSTRLHFSLDGHQFVVGLETHA